MTNTTITCLVEDTAGAAGLRAEHGLSMLVEIDDQDILLDTGQSALVTENARSLGADLANVTAVVLSHGHYDHTGGLWHALGSARTAKVYAHPAAFDAKYAKRGDGSCESIGSPLNEHLVKTRCAELVLSEKPLEIASGVWMSGEVPRVTSWETTRTPFYLDANCARRTDPLLDDQCVFFDSPNGPVILVGCAHAGIVNMLEHVASLTAKPYIHAVVGGIHLVNASTERIDKTIDAFRRFNVQRIGLGHCTGFDALRRFWDAFEERCFLLTVGARVTSDA